MSGKPGTLPKEHLLEIASRGGRSRSAVKLAAIAENGARGGRPRMFQVRMGVRDSLEPRGRADGRVMWGAVLRRVLGDGKARFTAVRTASGGVRATWSGGAHECPVPGLWDTFSRDVGRILRATAAPGEFRGVVRALRHDAPWEDWRAVVNATADEVVVSLERKGEGPPIAPPNPKDVIRRAKRELADNRKMVGLLRKLGASDEEIAKGMELPGDSPALARG